MKLKIYRISIFTCLLISIALTSYFLTISVLDIIGIEQEKMMDGIMYIVCLVLNLAFLGLEVFNTYRSLTTGSNFAKNLAINEDGSLNKRFLVVLGFIDVFVLFAIIYLSVIYKGVYDLPLNELAPLAKAVSIVFSVTVFVNITHILLFPILGKQDPSMQQVKNQKTSEE